MRKTVIAALALLAALLPLGACGRGESERAGGDRSNRRLPSGASNDSHVYLCEEGYRFLARIDDGQVWLYLPEREETLQRVPSASGAKFVDDDVLFWDKGHEALLEVRGETHHGCRHDRLEETWERARRSGVDFRALGQEPGWLLEIDHGRRITLLADYGERRFVAPAPPPEREEDTGRITYKADTGTHALEIAIEREPCRDIMSGHPYPNAVLIKLDGRELRGCGRWLR